MDEKKVRIAINGFGRIGRQAFKACFGVTEDSRMRLSPRIDPDKIEVVAINDLVDVRILAHLLRYDTIYGRYLKEITVEHNGEVVDWEGNTSGDDHDIDLTDGESYLVINGHKVRACSEKDPANLPWEELDVDVVIESTGFFTNYEDAKAHLEAGAKKVIISAPAKGEEGEQGKTLVFGTEAVEDGIGDFDVTSNASCTTNCVSPVMQILHSKFGVENAFLTTVHGYTSTQNLVDAPNKKDLRRARAAAENIIPTSTGAAKATAHAIPDLKDRFDGMAMRVPVPTGSISDITAVLKKEVSADEINNAFIEMADHPLYKDVLVVTEEPIVSSDVIGNPASSIVDLEFTKAVGTLVKVIAWYDNEWGYSNRLVEMAYETGNHM